MSSAKQLLQIEKQLAKVIAMPYTGGAVPNPPKNKKQLKNRAATKRSNAARNKQRRLAA